MYIIKKLITDLEAAHLLEGLPPDHKCSRLHGHSYKVEIVLESETLIDVGFVFDFGDLAPFVQYVKDKMDHRYLNKEFDFNPTCENLAEHLYQVAYKMFPQVRECTVFETRTGKATYRPLKVIPRY